MSVETNRRSPDLGDMEEIAERVKAMEDPSWGGDLFY
jgi:hypothetical protein